MLREAVEIYLSLRRSLGFELDRPGKLLHSFARFAAERGEAHVVTLTAIAWASTAPSAKQRDKRLRIVRRFALHVRAEDERHELPPDGGFGGHSHQQPIPFIYAAGEIRRLIEAASLLGPLDSLRPHTYSTLLGLLAATGLRISEALGLRQGDLTPDGLLILETKFRKSRLVPLHETTSAALARYLERRRSLASIDDHVFVSLGGRKLRYKRVHEVFLSLVRPLGLRRAPEQPAPRLHDLRHTFAVRALEACSGNRDEIGRHILALSTYMGHVSVASTYWYFQATPELMTDLRSTWEAFVEGATS